MKRVILKDGTELEVVALASDTGYGASFSNREEYERMRLKMTDENLSEYHLYTVETQEQLLIRDKTLTSIKTIESVTGEVQAEFYLTDVDSTQKKLDEAESTIAELKETVSTLSNELSTTQDALDFIMFLTTETTL